MCWEWQKERLVLDRLKDRQREIGKIAAANTTHTIGKKEREREREHQKYVVKRYYCKYNLQYVYL